ncbi:ORF-44 [Agrotis segetum nucleopolyhedrovirus A]|uniref:ORF-44 n=1 Tax=Agrotis segetum nuclear polyhedrosis virus TaxID=1962501 RepID=Q287M8_NPVAS|nr:ORF-44 [Agrotis segetum nucleopolyhedrovirus A]AAZ38210.1 ORF-44 [Agrotis segetum nucleopolyhedrovirus A]
MNVKLKSASQMLNAILNIGNLVDTSKANGQHLFYALCVSYIKMNVSTSTALNTLKIAFDKIIQTERTIFRRQRVLDFVLRYLADHSDGDNIQCRINLECLDYLMSKYIDNQQLERQQH